MEKLGIIALTHKTLSIEELGLFQIPKEDIPTVSGNLAKITEIAEFQILATCNRVELIFVCKPGFSPASLTEKILGLIYPGKIRELAEVFPRIVVFEGETAANHLFRVASSLESLVVGEREILAQVKESYDLSHSGGGTSDFLRLLVKKTILTAKEIYSSTGIARNPVSVVSLAYRKLKALQVPLKSRFILVGAGETNVAMARYLFKHGFRNFSVFNRTPENAEKLAGEIQGKAFPLEQLPSYTGGFDVIISCTGAETPLITTEVFKHLLAGETSKKIVIDLAVPADVDSGVVIDFNPHHITINHLREIAAENFRIRQNELSACEAIIEKNMADFRIEYKARQIELAMMAVPQKVREIKEIALQEVFAKDLQKLDPPSREVLEKMMDYMERKYISVTMKMAREILLEKSGSNN
jgi:glutamyl-tRNA reductase